MGGAGVECFHEGLSVTVLNKADERPYLKNTLLIDEIMTTTPRIDRGGNGTALGRGGGV